MLFGAVLLDTDVLIEYLRGRPKAKAYFDELTTKPLISGITVGELYSGVRNDTEEDELRSFLRAFEAVPLSRQIAEVGGLYRRDFGPSHGVGLADAMIAGTARIRGVPLVTFNRKHFPMLDNVTAPYSRDSRKTYKH